jgi:type I restriction enzyme M protein
MREDHGVDGDAQRLSQLCWMLFLKIFDEKEEEAELLNASYTSPIPPNLRYRNFAKNSEGITGDNCAVASQICFTGYFDINFTYV